MAALLALTVVTGLVDAVSYLRLGHVFVANMTGNVVFLGLSADPHSGLSPTASVIAIGGFVLGALAGGRVGHRLAVRPGRWLATAFAAEAATLALVAVLTGTGALPFTGDASFGAIALLAAALGLQNSTVRPVLAAVMPVGFGTAGTAFGTMVTATSSVADRDQGVVGGLMNTSRQVGAAIGAALLPAVTDAVNRGDPTGAAGDRAAMLVAAATAATATAVAWHQPRHPSSRRFGAKAGFGRWVRGGLCRSTSAPTARRRCGCRPAARPGSARCAVLRRSAGRRRRNRRVWRRPS